MRLLECISSGVKKSDTKYEFYLAAKTTAAFSKELEIMEIFCKFL